MGTILVHIIVGGLVVWALLFGLVMFCNFLRKEEPAPPMTLRQQLTESLQSQQFSESLQHFASSASDENLQYIYELFRLMFIASPRYVDSVFSSASEIILEEQNRRLLFKKDFSREIDQSTNKKEVKK